MAKRSLNTVLWVRSTVAHQMHVFGLRKATSIRFLLGVGSTDFCTIIHYVLFTAYGSLLRRIGPSTPVGSSRPADMQFAAQLPPPPPNL
ncbi:hypothetical protein CF319_g9024 [Tilletia indica]|nr:hypothetical protein CF319_g9024 [Tilletia indica]